MEKSKFIVDEITYSVREDIKKNESSNDMSSEVTSWLVAHATYHVLDSSEFLGQSLGAVDYELSKLSTRTYDESGNLTIQVFDDYKSLTRESIEESLTSIIDEQVKNEYKRVSVDYHDKEALAFAQTQLV